jgi:hypothetical protein
MRELLLTTAVLLVSARASAQAPPETAGAPSPAALATELFHAGRDRLAAGGAREACPLLAESARLAARVATLAKLAECEERLGRLVAARAHWQQALDLARKEGDERQALVRAEGERLDRAVPRIRIVLPRERPADLEVLLDDVRVGPSLLAVAIPVDPGRHVVRATAPGRHAWSRSIESAADGAVAVVTVPELPQDAPRPVPTGRGGSRAVTALEAAGIAATALGVGGAALGAFFTGVAVARRDASNDAGCEGNRCPARAAEIREDARAAGDAATGFFVVGGALAVGGVLLFVLAPAPSGGARPQATVGALPAGLGLTAGGRW